MARPRTEDGFVMVAIDLFPAILAAGLSGYAQIVLAEVLVQSYGPHKKDRVFLHGTELGELTGLDRNAARRAIAELVESNVLKADGQAYVFNKDYESWTPTPGPLGGRLRGGLLAWIKGMVERCGTPKTRKRSNKDRETTQSRETAARETTESHPNETTKSQESPCIETTQSRETAARETTESQGDGGPLKERACVRELVSTYSESPSNEKRKEDVRREDRENDDGISIPPATKLGPEYTAVGQLAIDLACDFSWGRWVDEQGLMGRPAAWIKRAIETASGNGKLSKPYVAEILRGYQKAGGPPPDQPLRFAQAARPATPPPPTVKADPESVHPKNRSEAEHRAVASKWGVPLDDYFADPRVARFVQGRATTPLEQTA